jgi:HEAT repeat protein
VGIMNLFGGPSPQRAVKLKAKVTQKYGDPATRQKAISQLGEMKYPEAVASLLARFTITVEPATTDADEKEHVFQLVKSFGAEAIEPVKTFLRKSEHATSWALRLLEALLPEPEVVGTCCELLEQLSREYSRDPAKKVVVLSFLGTKDDPRVPAVALPFLEDMSDDVKLAALKTLAPHKYEPSREPVLQLLTHPDTARRVQMAVVTALAESGLGVQGYREKVEALAQDPFFVDKNGLVKKRG